MYDTDDDKSIYVRSLSKSRTSLSVNIPFKIARAMELDKNSVVRVEYNDMEQILTISKIEI